MPSVQLVWYGRLKPCPRPKAARSGGVYYPSDYKRHLNLLRAWFENETAEIMLPANTNYALRVTVYKQSPVDSRLYGDVDNLLKTVLDMLPFDDARVTSAMLHKRRCEQRNEERVEIVLSFPEGKNLPFFSFEGD